MKGNCAEKCIGVSSSLALMQPYFFPYIGYYSLAACADKFLFFDEAQYIKQGWVNRNRIELERNGRKEYIKIPTKKSSHTTPINEKQISDQYDWRSKIMNQLKSYISRSENFEEVNELVKNIIYFPTSNLSEICIRSVTLICDYLDVDYWSRTTSELVLPDVNKLDSHEHAIRYTNHYNLDSYINPPGAIGHLYKQKTFESAGLNLYSLYNNSYFNENGNLKTQPMSILHDLFLYGKQEVKRMVNDYRVIKVEYES